MTYADTPIGEFLDAVASERAAPAGGTAAAIAGATGAALCEMVCIQTADAEDGRPDATPRPDGPTRRTRLQRKRDGLLALAERDGAVVEDLFGGGEATTRLQRRAIGIPLAVSEAALDVLIDAEVLFRNASPGVAADAKTGAYLADCAVGASLDTVRINAAATADQSFAASIEDRADDVAASAAPVRKRMFGIDR
jgi:formiminotetrahydrofolate cyclodeaminase